MNLTSPSSNTKNQADIVFQNLATVGLLSDSEKNVCKQKTKICIENPSTNVFKKLSNHTWQWLKNVILTVWNKIFGNKTPDGEVKVFIRTEKGYIYDTLLLNKTKLEDLLKSHNNVSKENFFCANNPSAKAKYLTYKCSDNNNKINSGNLLQILDSACTLKDDDTIKKCTAYLRSITTYSNSKDLLAIANYYKIDNKLLKTFQQTTRIYQALEKEIENNNNEKAPSTISILKNISKAKLTFEDKRELCRQFNNNQKKMISDHILNAIQTERDLSWVENAMFLLGNSKIENEFRRRLIKNTNENEGNILFRLHLMTVKPHERENIKNWNAIASQFDSDDKETRHIAIHTFMRYLNGLIPTIFPVTFVDLQKKRNREFNIIKKYPDFIQRFKNVVKEAAIEDPNFYSYLKNDFLEFFPNAAFKIENSRAYQESKKSTENPNNLAEEKSVLYKSHNPRTPTSPCSDSE